MSKNTISISISGVTASGKTSLIVILARLLEYHGFVVTFDSTVDLKLNSPLPTGEHIDSLAKKTKIKFYENT